MRKYDPDIHHRRSIRLQGYDYSRNGFYFVTICTQHRLHLFGEIMDGKMCLHDAGNMVHEVWNAIPRHYPGIGIDTFIVMPNHIHGILTITAENPNKLGLANVVQRFKTMTTKHYTDGVKQHSWEPFPGKLWQRNYWEHIIRNERSRQEITIYITNNPAQWPTAPLNQPPLSTNRQHLIMTPIIRRGNLP